MTDYKEHRGVSRKTFLMYLLQLPIFGGIASYLYGFEAKKLYLLNKFSVAGFYFYEGTKLLNKMKPGDILKMKPNAENIEDEYAVELHFKDKLIGYIPRSDNRHIFRLLEQEKDLVCTIREIDPEAETWQMCKVKVELVG
tara:strand:+ start:4119 stop:4538 length:420 start_codon:yes stop_codon:yes gene_type:complete